MESRVKSTSGLVIQKAKYDDPYDTSTYAAGILSGRLRMEYRKSDRSFEEYFDGAVTRMKFNTGEITSMQILKMNNEKIQSLII